MAACEGSKIWPEIRPVTFCEASCGANKTDAAKTNTSTALRIFGLKRKCMIHPLANTPAFPKLADGCCCSDLYHSRPGLSTTRTTRTTRTASRKCDGLQMRL